jgi:predicted  nucleic acid-binding Zn-ribbon protein
MRKRLALDKKLSEDRKILQELQMENTKLEDEKRKLEEEIRRHNQHWTEEWETPLKNRIEGVRQDRQKLSKDLRGIQEAIRAVWEGWKGLLK